MVLKQKTFGINDDLTIDELILIMENYPVIQRMYEMKSESDLLTSPFYINMIVSRKMDIEFSVRNILQFLDIAIIIVW